MAGREEPGAVCQGAGAVKAWVKREIVRPRSTGSKLLWTGIGVATAVGVRWLIDRGHSGFPFVTFSPVILLCAIFLDWRYAVMSAVFSAGAVLGLFRPPGSPEVGVLFVGLYALTIGMLVVAGEILRQMVRENEAHAARADAFNTELQHRTKNALQMMRALASRASRATDPAEFYEMLSGRLDALARSNELLRFGVLPACGMADLVHAVLEPFHSARVRLEGPGCDVDRNAVTPLMMALHELCTNATKYGALSCDEGTVSIRWSAPQEGRIVLDWQEQDGPPVVQPTRRGIGSRLLKPHGGLTRVDLAFDPAGVRCHFEITAAP